MHRSPGGVSCEVSFPARNIAAVCRPSRRAGTTVRVARPAPGPEGLRRTRAYTPAMRRWVCIVALLAGFTRDDYVHAVRLREPVAIERLIDTRQAGAHGLVPTGAWWSRLTG